MQLKYDLIEDRYEETTQMRTTTEQVQLTDGSWLLRTVMYTPYLITADVSQISAVGDSRKKKKKKNKQRKLQKKSATLFDPIV